MKTKYPIFIPSKDRYNNCLTPKYLIKDNIDFKIVVEPVQYNKYAEKFNKKYLLVLPRNNMKLLGSRNWIMEYSIKQGDKRHWQLDDNIRGFKRLYKSIRIRVNGYYALKFVEDITDNYKNIGISGMNYEMFVTPKTKSVIVVNHHIYSCSLINNEIPYRWRLIYNDDTDLCIQILKGNWCTLYTNVFSACKIRTMTMKGGNTDQLYQDKGRFKMAKSLEMLHPDIVKTKWRFGRPQHVVNWEVFKQRLIPVDNPKKIGLNNYGKLIAVGKIKNKQLKELLIKANNG